MESFSTDRLVQGERARAWNEIYSALLSATDFIPCRRDFSADLKVGDKVTVHYTMTATNIEAKPAKGKKDEAKAAASPAKQ